MKELRKLNWNEEYAIKFVLNGHKFSTPNGTGYAFRFDLEDEIKRLKSKGASNIKVYIRKWN